MPEDAGASTATDGASQDTQSQAQGQSQGQGQDAGASQNGAQAGAASGTDGDGGDDRSPEDMLADAHDGGDGDGDGKDDPAAQVKRLEKQLADTKRHSRTWETRAKENSAAAAKLKEFEDKDKTELQRATDRAVQAEQASSKWETLYHRTLAAARYDLDPSLIDRISGTTEDEINASAEQLAAAINSRASALAEAAAKANGGNGQQQAGGAWSGRPVEALRPGGLPASDSQPTDPNAWMRAALKKR